MGKITQFYLSILSRSDVPLASSALNGKKRVTLAKFVIIDFC